MTTKLIHPFLVSFLLFSVCYECDQSSDDLDRLCDLTNPLFRLNLLNDAMKRLQNKYDIGNGLAVFGICDPTDPNINPDCLNYNNPSVAYGSTLVPCPDNGECPPETPSSFLSGKSGLYQPMQDHGLVLFGCLPPKTDYFGIRTYLYEKAKFNVEDDLDCSNAMSSPTGEEVNVFPPNPTVNGSRVVVDIPWYNTRNQLSINASGKPDSHTKFRSLFVHVTTANKQVAEDIVEAFTDSGVPVEAMNIDSIPNMPVFHLEGNSSIRDSFRTIYRLVLPESSVSTSDTSTQEIEKYISAANMNILVRYLTPKVLVPKNGFPATMPTKRTVGQHEKDTVGEKTFQVLLSAVKSIYGEPNYVSYPIPIVINTTKCLRGCYGFGNNEDTVYINTDRNISLAGAGDFAVVCGANHVVLQTAVYTNVGIFNTSGLAVGVATDEMKLNSAVRFAEDLPHIRKFYCLDIRSHCNGEPFCIQPIFEDVKTVLVQFRINLNPHTKTGPATNEIIWPVTLGYYGKSH